MKNLFRISLFFPSINFSLIKAEIFPWPLLVTLLHPIRLKIDDLVLLFLLFFNFSIAILLYPNFNTVVTAASYLSPLLAYIFIKNASQTLLSRILDIIPSLFWFLTILGCAQYLGLLSIFEPIFDMLLSRGGSTVFGAGRGVMLLSTEPSRAGVEYLFIAAVYFMVSPSLKMRLMIIFVALVVIVFLIKSSVALLFLCLWLLFLHPVKSVAFFFILISVFVLHGAIINVENFRSMSMILGIIDSDSFYDTFIFLLQQSGFRFISVYSAYFYSLNEVFGNGVGSWVYVAADSYKMAGFQPDQISFFRYYYDSSFISLKPTAFFALVALELGIPGLIVGVCYIGWQFNGCSFPLQSYQRATILIFFVSVFLLGSVGNPVYWAAFALSLRYKSNRT